MNDSLKRMTGEVTAVIERSLRQELLREREATLAVDLAAIRAEIGRLGAKRPVRARAKKPVRVAAPAPKRVSGAQLTQHASGRDLLVRTLRAAGRPMTIKELTKSILRKGWKSAREDPSKTVDVALRHNTKMFRKTAPGTFELIR